MNQNPNLNQNAEDSDSAQNQSDLTVEVESHETRQQPESGSFADTLRSAADSIGLFDDSDSPAPDSKKTKNKKANQEEFNTLVIAVLTLALSFANLPPNIAPNQNEINVFSNHLAGIVIRHLPVAKGFSADALDLIGLFAVLSAYYARIAPEIKQTKRIPPAAAQQQPTQSVAADPIKDLSPEVGQFLTMAAAKGI